MRKDTAKPRTRWLKNFCLLSANDDRFLAKQLLQTLPIPSPPSNIERGVHHFINDDFFSLRFFAGPPMSFRRRSTISSQAAESLGQLALDGREMLSWQRAALIISQWQQNLN